MERLAKEFADIINEQDFCFDLYEMKIDELAIKAVNEWEEQNKDCFGCFHLGDKKYKCELCVRFGHVDHYVFNT